MAYVQKVKLAFDTSGVELHFKSRQKKRHCKSRSTHSDKQRGLKGAQASRGKAALIIISWISGLLGNGSMLASRVVFNLKQRGRVAVAGHNRGFMASRQRTGSHDACSCFVSPNKSRPGSRSAPLLTVVTTDRPQPRSSSSEPLLWETGRALLTALRSSLLRRRRSRRPWTRSASRRR